MDTKLIVLGLFAVWSAVLQANNFLVIDVSSGEDAEEYPVEKFANVPSGGWRDEYKTDKIVLSKVSEGGKEFYNEFRPFGKYRVIKGGHCECKAAGCASSVIYGAHSSLGCRGIKGFRIASN